MQRPAPDSAREHARRMTLGGLGEGPLMGYLGAGAFVIVRAAKVRSPPTREDAVMQHTRDGNAGSGATGNSGGGMTTGRLEEVRVLIVDDDRDVLESIDVAFQSEGALTQPAMDGNEAVRICREDPPDLVILDMMLPKRSGFLALEKIKGREDSPVVIMVTANEGKRHQAYAESLGVDAYLLKPVPLERLLSRAVELLDAADEADEE
ncbi:MAG: response regulator [Planctomycetota bacterium]|nr:response regulator [Planctomycetota bacterium]